MSEEATEQVLVFTAYCLAGLSVLLVAYLGWRRLRRRRHGYRRARARTHHLHGSRG